MIFIATKISIFSETAKFFINNFLTIVVFRGFEGVKTKLTEP